MITEDIKQNILSLIDTTDQELVGLVYKDGTVTLNDNIHFDIKHNFAISKRVITKNVIAIWHTHNGDDSPGIFSFEDIQSSKKNKIPFILYHTGFNVWDYYDPNDLNPFPLKPIPFTPNQIEFYKNWSFVDGRSDCYTICKAFYQGFLGIILDDFDRPKDENVFAPGWNRFNENMESQGFREVDEPQPYDFLIMNILGNPLGHHIAIYLGDNNFLHNDHPKKLSSTEFYSDYYQRRTIKIWRHYANFS